MDVTSSPDSFGLNLYIFGRHTPWTVLDMLIEMGDCVPRFSSCQLLLLAHAPPAQSKGAAPCMDCLYPLVIFGYLDLAFPGDLLVYRLL